MRSGLPTSWGRSSLRCLKENNNRRLRFRLTQRTTNHEQFRMRVLSGIQPTGRFHWGNYFGAIRQYIDLQHGNESYYFIANLHALTTIRDPGALKQNTL